MLLSIIIPTYNRSISLINNLKNLENCIIKEDICDDVEIIVSDNDSDDKEKNIIKSYVPNDKCNVLIHFQNHNIGFEDNMLFLLDKSTGKYTMTMGDDDFIDYELFNTIISYIKKDEFRSIVCNFYNVNEKGEKISDYRDPIRDDLIYLTQDFRLASLGHQMSCLIFLTDGLYDAYKNYCKKTLYPQVFFVGYSMIFGKGVHITRFPYKNTVLDKKNFNYDFDNLLDEICVAYDCIPIENKKERIKYLKYFVKCERDRFIGKNTFFKPIRFIKKVKNDYDISDTFKRIILNYYIIENVKLPFKYLFFLMKGKGK